MPIANLPAIRACRLAWNKGSIFGQKRPLEPKHVWTIRVRLEIAKRNRELALFNLAIDSKLRGRDMELPEQTGVAPAIIAGATPPLRRYRPTFIKGQIGRSRP